MGFGHYPCFDRIIVQVAHFLPKDSFVAQLKGVIAVLPELVVTVIGTSSSVVTEHVHEPLSSAFV